MDYYTYMLSLEQDKYDQGYYDAPDEDEDIDEIFDPLEWLDDEDYENILGMNAQEYMLEILAEHF